jgi:hypothetical protein
VRLRRTAPPPSTKENQPDNRPMLSAAGATPERKAKRARD